MLRFQPPGFSQTVIETSLGVMAYYTSVSSFWQPDSPPHLTPDATSDSTPVLLFLHSLGGGSSAYEWSKVYPAFAADYRIIAPDLIGWGQSTHPQRQYRVEDYLQMVTELIEQTTWAPVIVFASSLMGAIAIRLASQRPELFHKLLLVCPSGYGDFGEDYRRNLAAQLTKVPVLDRWIYQLGAANEIAIQTFLEQFLFAQRSRITPEIVAAYLASAQQLNADYAALSSLRGDVFFDLSLYVNSLKVPTVLFWGENARFGSPSKGRRLAQLNPQAIATFHEIPNAGVLPHLEVPEIFIGLAQQHL